MKKSLPRNTTLSWILRIVLVLTILFFALFSLDVFDSEHGVWEIIIGLFMHNIPSMVMIVILVIALKREDVAGMLLVLCALGFGVFIGMNGRFMWGTLILLAIPVLIGVLFIANHYFFGKKQSE